MCCALTDSSGLSIRNCVLMFEIYVIPILHLLIERLTHCFCDILLAHEREPRNPLVGVDLHDLKIEYN